MVSRDLFERYECFCMYTMWWESLPEINKEWPCDDHEGYYETSMMLAVNEDIIDMAKAKEAPNIQLTEKLKYNRGWRFNEAEINVPWDLYNLQKIGNMDNPSEGANIKLGKKC